MTAEIVIINQQAVALAADSAVTIGKNRVWKHANKLFSFGPNNDIGVMIYNSGDYLSTPWEVIIKEFRAYIGGRVFHKLQSFADEFVSFVKSEKFSSSHFESISFGLIFADIIEKLRERVDYTDRADLQRQIIDVVRDQERAFVDLAEIEGVFSFEIFKRKFRTLIRELIVQEFEINIGRQPTEIVMNFMYDFIRHEAMSDYFTGIVIAGYGRKELFPSVYHHIFDGRYLGFTRSWQAAKCFDLNNKRSQDAAIIPFAQADMAQLFMEGIAPQHTSFLSRVFLQITRQRFHNLIDNLIADPDQRIVEKALQDKEIDSVHKAFQGEFRKYRRKSFTKPILDTIRALPKEEMAYMARAMVEITALRRRFASNVESVGGEIDVAIISKSDGFIWINRKHYFRLDLNPDFLQRKSMLNGGARDPSNG